MAVDLEELERKAKAATQESWGTSAVAGRLPDYFSRYAIVTTEGGEQVADAFDNTTWSDEQCAANARHIAANSPPVTLALIARIRELESAARELGEMARMGYREDVYSSREAFAARRGVLAEIVAKGVELP